MGEVYVGVLETKMVMEMIEVIEKYYGNNG